jgi:hypothetical protein
MRERLTILLLTALILTLASAPLAAASSYHFTGDTSGKTEAFAADGPWLLGWSVRAPTRLGKNFEMRLFNADNGEFVGTIAQLEGIGHGRKLFEEAGNYQIQVIAQGLEWELHIQVIDAAVAEEEKRLTLQGPSLEDKVQKVSRLVEDGSFVSWRAVDDETLLLFAEDKTRGFKVTFSPACPGLKDATALSFVTPMRGGLENFDSILLDDGTGCYFERVVPTVFD